SLMRIRLGAGALLLTALAVSAPGAGFDCAKAHTRAEKLICATPELSKDDERLAVSYKNALAAAEKLPVADRNALKQEQVAWIKVRVANCPDAGCLQSAYQSRIAALDYYTAHAARAAADPADPTGTYSSDHGSLQVLRLEDGKVKVALMLSFGDHVGALDGE